jgi:hypothetical protein
LGFEFGPGEYITYRPLAASRSWGTRISSSNRLDNYTYAIEELRKRARTSGRPSSIRQTLEQQCDLALMLLLSFGQDTAQQPPCEPQFAELRPQAIVRGPPQENLGRHRDSDEPGPCAKRYLARWRLRSAVKAAA